MVWQRRCFMSIPARSHRLPHVAAASAHIQVVTPVGTIDGPTLPLNGRAGTVIGIFQNSQAGLAAALNQDGTINSASNPARSGQIVTVFATADSGNYFPDGALVPIGIYNAGVSVWVVTANRSLEVVFAGNAPGLVAGVMQINFRLPNPLPAGNTFAFTVEIAEFRPLKPDRRCTIKRRLGARNVAPTGSRLL